MLTRAIRSVLAQDFSDFEVHVCDDASGDGTRETVEKLACRDRRIKYFCHPQRVGMMANFASGIERVQSPFFNFLNDDDFLLPGFFRAAASGFARMPQAKWFIGSLVNSDSRGRISAVPAENWREGLNRPPEAFVKLAAPDTWMSWTAMVFSREVLATTRGLDISLGHSADIDFELRTAVRHPAVVCKHPCAVFLQHPESATFQKGPAYLLAAFRRIDANVQCAIAAAESDGQIDRGAGDAMRHAMRSGLRARVFRAALVLARRDRSAMALEAADTLERHFSTPTLARIVRLMAAESAQGAAARSVFRVAHRLRSLWRPVRYSRYRPPVVRALDQASHNHDAAAGPAEATIPVI